MNLFGENISYFFKKYLSDFYSLKLMKLIRTISVTRKTDALQNCISSFKSFENIMQCRIAVRCFISLEFQSLSDENNTMAFYFVAPVR